MHDTYDPAIRVISPRILEQSLSAGRTRSPYETSGDLARLPQRPLGRLGKWNGSVHDSTTPLHKR